MTLGVFLLALVLGMAGAMAPLGPVTLLVLRRGMQGDYAGGLKVGFGRVLPETIYCGLATFGAAAAIEEFPEVKLWIQAIGAMLLLILGSYFAFAKFADNPDDSPKSKWGDWSGLIIASLNPALILSWSAVAAIAIATTHVTPTTTQKLVFAGGVGTGVTLGYLTLISTLRRFGERLNAKFIRTVIRLVGVGFVAASIWNIVQLVTVFTQTNA